MRPLRAYLLLVLPSGEVEVSTHRDLESVETTWRKRRSLAASAALHVGYWRPETEAFVEALRSHPGRILLSGSAVHALPPSFRSSSAPICSAGALPLHMALSGWGYEADDPSVSSSSASDPYGIVGAFPSQQPMEDPEIKCEWLLNLSMENPAIFEQALNEGILDEQSYLQAEERLPNSLRGSLGEARFRWLCPTPPTEETIFDCIASTPPWFQSLPIGVLRLSTRPANVLSAASIRQIGDLSRYDSHTIYKLWSMGKKSFNEIGRSLLSVLSGGVNSDVLKSHITPPPDRRGTERTISNEPRNTLAGLTTFSAAMQAAMELLTTEERPLMEMRMGMGGNQRTLAEIGDAYGLSRERIRQIETRSLGKMRSITFWNLIMGPRIRHILSERDDFLAPHGLEILEPALKGSAESLDVLEYVLERFVEPEMHLVKEGGLFFVTEIKQQEWIDVTRAAKKLLERLTDKRPSIQEARNMVDGLLVGRGAELREELWGIATKAAHFANGRLVSYGSGAEPFVFAILESSEIPLHYSTILEILREKGHEFDSPRVRHAAAEVGLLLGRGTYGTMRHFPLDEAETRLVVSESEDLIEGEGAGRQWHARELSDRLEERGIECGGNLTPYVVSIALLRSKNLTYLGRMIWASNSTGARGVANRLDVHQAVVSILIDNEKPMLTEEIRERLVSERGVNHLFQIQPEGRLVRIGSGLWGLMDRDVPFSEEESGRVMKTLRTVLMEKGKGIHVSEILDDLDEKVPIVRRVKDPVLLLGLGQKWDGLSVSRGQFIYLSEWLEPRRKGLREALLEVLTNAGREGVTIQEGITRVSDLIERPFPPNQHLGQMALNIGAVFDHATKSWRLPSEEEIFSESEEADA